MKVESFYWEWEWTGCKMIEIDIPDSVRSDLVGTPAH